jgi:hypothetical protein
MSLTPEETARLQELEAEATQREELQRKAESHRLDQIAETFREGGYPDHADVVVVMTNLTEFYNAWKGELRRDLRDADWDLAEELDQERDERITVREAEEEAHRKEEEAARVKAEEERHATLTDEPIEAEDATDAAVAAEQALEDGLQGMMAETFAALEKDDVYTRPGVMKFPGDAQLRPMPVKRDENGNVVLDATGHAIPVPFEPAYRQAARDGAGLLGIKHLADEVIALPRALQSEWWDQRTEAEKHALSRGFGVRPPVRKDEVIHDAHE